jgi:hypothetical protein
VSTLAALLLLAGTGLVHAGPAPEPSGPQTFELILSKTISIRRFASPGDVIEVPPETEEYPRAPPLLLVYSGEKSIRCTVVNGLYLINGKVTGVFILRGDTSQSIGLRVGKHGPDIRALVLDNVGTLPEDAITKLFQVAKGTLTVSARFRTDIPVIFGRELQELSGHVGRIRAAQIEPLLDPCLPRARARARARARKLRGGEDCCPPRIWIGYPVHPSRDGGGQGIGHGHGHGRSRNPR